MRVDMKIDCSIGEILDKMSILTIKIDKLTDDKKAANATHEYTLLCNSLKEEGLEHLLMSTKFKQLIKINKELWNIEDEIRIKEKYKEFDEKFIELARLVYIKNDERYQTKRSINEEFNSSIVEEKQYADYRKDNV